MNMQSDWKMNKKNISSEMEYKDQIESSTRTN